MKKVTLEQINPKNGSKYSTNLYRFVKRWMHRKADIPKVYADTNGYLLIGVMDEKWFLGSSMATVLCCGSRSKTYAYSITAEPMKEKKTFWNEYIKDGRCAIDRKHEISFMCDQNRWEMRGKNIRHCLWCGKVKQIRERKTKRVVSYSWVQA